MFWNLSGPGRGWVPGWQPPPPSLHCPSPRLQDLNGNHGRVRGSDPLVAVPSQTSSWTCKQPRRAPTCRLGLGFPIPPVLRSHRRPASHWHPQKTRIATMPPRPRAILAQRPFQALAARRCYSTANNEAPLIRVTNVPAPNTGHIRVLELNRPSARNAISRALLASLRGEIDDVHSQYDASTGEELAAKSWNRRFGGAAGQDDKGPTRALILASAVDSSFCAGADLKERRGFTPEEYVFPRGLPSGSAPGGAALRGWESSTRSCDRV